MWIVAFAAFLAAAVWTWPLASVLSSEVPCDPRFATPHRSDTFTALWDFWWARQVVERGAAPFFCDRIFWPDGHCLVLHNHVLLLGILSVPLQWIAGLTFAHNTILLLLLTVGSGAVYRLARDIGAAPLGAALAAFAWTFSPYFLQKGLEHLNLFASPWPPLALLYLRRWMGANGRPDWRCGARLGGVFGLALLTSWWNAVGTAVSAVVFVLLAPGFRSEKRREARRGLLRPAPLLGFCSVALLLASPILVEISRERCQLARHQRVQVTDAPRLADFVTPPGLHPLLSGQGDPESGTAPDGGGMRNESSGCAIGFALLLSAAAGVVLVPPSRRFASMFLVLFVFAWDPDGRISDVYRSISGLHHLRVPQRFLPFALLPLSLAAGLGVDELLRRRGPRAIVAVLLVAGVAFESWTRPFPTAAPRIPEAVLRIGRMGDEGAVLVLPFRPGADEGLVWQTVHGHPVTTSYVARLDPRTFGKWESTAREVVLLALHGRIEDSFGLAFDLEYLGIHHILLRTGEEGSAGLVAGLDGLERWERGPLPQGAGEVMWWIRSSLAEEAAASSVERP